MSAQDRRIGAEAWLGPAAEDMTPDQLEDAISRLARAWEAVEASYPPPQGEDTRADTGAQVAADAAGQYVLGDLAVWEAAQEVEQARTALGEAQDRLRGAVIAAVTVDGASIADTARQAGVDRTTVYRWLGTTS